MLTTQIASASLAVLLERFPWATLSDEGRGESERLSCRNGAYLWLAVAGRDNRLPGPFDTDVYVALCALFNEDRKPESGKVDFQFRELCQLMKRHPGGTTYDALERALKRLLDVRIFTHHNPDDKSTEDTGFTVLSQFSITTQQQHRAGSVVLNPLLVAQKFRLVDVQTYFSLERPTTKRLYRYLDYRRWAGAKELRTLDLPLAELAAELPLPRAQPSQVELALKSAHSELKAIGYLESHGLSKLRAEYRFQDRDVAVARTIRESLEQGLLDTLLETFKDGDRSMRFYKKVVRTLPDQIVWGLFGNVKELAKTNPTRARKIFSADAKKHMSGLVIQR